MNITKTLRRAGPSAARLAAAACLASIAGTAQAGSASTSFNVTATVLDACSVSATDLAFGSYDPSATVDRSANSSISVNCTLGTLYTISLDQGSNASGGSRRMAAGANRLSYALYRDASSTLLFGALADLLNVSGIGTGVAAATTVYGVIPKGQNVGTGSYSDRVTVTVDY